VYAHLHIFLEATLSYDLISGLHMSDAVSEANKKMLLPSVPSQCSSVQCAPYSPPFTCSTFPTSY